MDRRRFTSLGATAIALLFVSFSLIGCGDDDEDPGEPSILFTSSIEAEHTHEFVLLVDEIEHPPAAGLNRETSEASGHTHFVILTATDLETIGDGDTVTRTTTEAGGHTHTFTMRRP